MLNPTYLKHSDQWTQLTNIENKRRAYQEPFPKEATLTIINNNKKWTWRRNMEVGNNTKYNNRNYKYRSDKNKQSTTTEFKKRKCGLCNEQRSTRKYWLTQSIKILGRNHKNFIQLRRTIEGIIGFQFDPAGNVINLSAKTFNRDVFKLLNKNLNFVSMQKIILTKRNFIMK